MTDTAIRVIFVEDDEDVRIGCRQALELDREFMRGADQPRRPERSGSPESLVDWNTMGRQGRAVVAGGPRVADVLHGVASPSLGAGLTTAVGGALVVVLTVLLSRPGSPFVRYRAPVA